MLSKSDAIELVMKKLDEYPPLVDDQRVLLLDKTIEKPYGWIFFYNSKKAIETGNVIYRLAGNGPVIVNKIAGSIEFFGSLPPIDVILDTYEKNLSHTQS